MWDQVSALAAIASLAISIIALIITIMGTRTSTQLASQALETARQANGITLGLIREPAVIEFSFTGASNFNFDFMLPDLLSNDSEHWVSVSNSGKKSIDSIKIEIIGIECKTLPSAGSIKKYEKLPFTDERLDLKLAIQPGGLANIDMRRFFLLYLERLAAILPDSSIAYSTKINVVMSPKAVNESIHHTAPSQLGAHDRNIFNLSFVPSFIASSEAQKILQDSNIPHRIID